MEAQIGEGLDLQQQFCSYNFMSKDKEKQVIEVEDEDCDDYDEGEHDWDANTWEWNTHSFTAKNIATIDKGKSVLICNDNNNHILGNVADKRRKVLAEEEEMAACLTLKLGGGSEFSNFMVGDGDGNSGKNGKRPRATSGASSHQQNSPVCQVDDCKAELNNAKDYHRRHKVCEMHAKATKALVGRLMQRFCQQCSRFHRLEEFDEGKRSCRRRLAGHNRRRRKTQSDAILAGACLNNEHTSVSLIISLLRVLSQLQTSNNSDHTSNQDLVMQLLKKFASSAGVLDGKRSEDVKLAMANEGDDHLTSNATLENVKHHDSFRTQDVGCNMLNHLNVASSSRLGVVGLQPDGFQSGRDSSICGHAQPFVSTNMTHNVFIPQDSAEKARKLAASYCNNTQESREGPQQQHEFKRSVAHSPWLQLTDTRTLGDSNSIDLNNIYNASEELNVGSDGPSTLMLLGGLDSRSTQSTLCHSLSGPVIHQTSPPQISDNSDSGSDRSLSNSQGDGQARTGRIVFKLFGKDPSEIPQCLRSQILNWLADSPSDIESYIRPGCIILTIYLRLPESVWEELDMGFKNSLERLLKESDSSFWQRGWIFAQVGHRIAFVCDGQVVFDAPSEFGNAPKLLSITPIAITPGKKANIVLKGLNLSSSTSKILCAFQGKYAVQESSTEYIQDAVDLHSHESEHLGESMQIQCRSFSWVPQNLNLSGRCFIEVESHDVRGSFFPIIVAEEEICAEICKLERYFKIPSKACECEATQNSCLQVKQKTEAIEFLHELGWLFQKSCLYQSNLDVLCSKTFSPTRFKWLLEYAIEQDWCAVVKKILNILFRSYAKSADSSAVTILDEIGVLHRAVRKNCRAMVEILLAYIPDCLMENTIDATAHRHDKLFSSDGFIFKPDMPGPAGLTPLHIAASMRSAEGVLDALTNDPCEIGVRAWTNVCDQTGKTPEDYALLGGHHSYIELVYKKVEKMGNDKHVRIDIPKLLFDEQSSLMKPVFGSCSASQEESGGTGKAQGNKTDVELCHMSGQSSSLFSDRGKIRRLPSYCKLCDQQLFNKRRTNTLLYRPAMLSMMAIATVCVCVTLLLKGPPQVLYVMPPFRWESIKFGAW